MSKYEARITNQSDSFYALIVRIDNDGEENVIRGFAKHYKPDTLPNKKHHNI